MEGLPLHSADENDVAELSGIVVADSIVLDIVGD